MKKTLLLLSVILLFIGCSKDDDSRPEPAITLFEVVGGIGEQQEVISGVIEGLNISLTLPGGTNVKALKPYINIDLGSEVFPASGIAQDFSSPVQYTVTNGGKSITYTVTATTGELKKNIYKFFAFSYSKDALFGALDIFNDETSTIYISDARGVLDAKYLPENVVSFDYLFYGITPGISYDVRDWPIYYKLMDVVKKDPNAEIHLYGTGNTIDAFCTVFSSDLGYDKVKITYLEDGTAEYSQLYSAISSPADAAKFNEAAAVLKDIFGYRDLTPEEKSIWLNSVATPSQYRLLPKTAISWFSSPDAFHNIKYPVNPDALSAMKKIEPLKLFKELPLNKQSQLIKAMKLDYTLFENKSFSENLVITGSAGDANFNAAQMKLVKQVYETYKNQYNIYFKGHPTNHTFPPLMAAEFPNNEIIMIPTSVPAEIMIAAGYADKLIGLFSSLYFGVPEDIIITIYQGGGYNAMPEYIREMLCPAGAFPSNQSKWGDFNQFYN